MSDRFLQINEILESGSATAYILKGNRRYPLFYATSIEGEVEIEKKDLNVLGRKGKLSRPTGWSGSGKIEIYYVTSLFTEMALEYSKTGKLPLFDMQITNEDKATELGRQTVIVKNCTPNKIPIISVNAEGEELKQEIEYTFDDFDLLEKFNELEGM